MRPEILLAGTFGTLIAIGAILLSLPFCHADASLGLLDAVFTATSAVCVTGLITVDTATAWSPAGQVVILALIQLGGLGVMTFGALAFQLLGRRVSLASHAALEDSFFQGAVRGGLRRAIPQIVALTLACELLGTILLYAGMRGTDQHSGGVFSALFLSVSAFCNAGFSVYSDSVMSLRSSPLIMGTFMFLIVVGGLGYLVVLELLQRAADGWRGRRAVTVRFSLHARIVLSTSALLFLGGAAALLLTGMGADARSWSERLAAAVFQSVSARTAGFNSVDIGLLPLPTLMILIPLMFVGGSPGSCAGGVKTTSFTIWLARVVARLRGEDDVTLFERRVPQDVVRRAALVLAVAGLWNATGVFLLACTERVESIGQLEGIVFEQVSAFGTVGLSTGITPHLSILGKLWIIASMFLGRVGPLTITLVVLKPLVGRPFRYPPERVMIG
jgi:trk system potassium uptake protein TrkH